MHSRIAPILLAAWPALAQPATPAVSPHGGSFADSVQVTLTCATPGALIYYSIDEGDTQRYVMPFWIRYSGTVRTWARTLAGPAQSEVDSAVFRLRFIRLVSPTGGELWLAGTTQYVEWEAENVYEVTVLLSVDWGDNYTRLDFLQDATDPDWGMTLLTVPVVSSARCEILIQPMLGSPLARSGSFTIADPRLVVTSPMEGDTWSWPGTEVIRWTAQDVEHVLVSLSTDAGNTYSLLQPTVVSVGDTNWGAFPLAIPKVYRHYCRARVQDFRGAAQAESGRFTIVAPYISMRQPHGGENFNPGDTVPIEWWTVALDRVWLHFSMDNGETWTEITPWLGVEVSSFEWQTYPWVAPDVMSTACRVAVAGFGWEAGVVSEIFTIQPTSSVGGASPQAAWTGHGASATVCASACIFDLHGRKVGVVRLRGGGSSLRIPAPAKPMLSRGAYCLIADGDGKPAARAVLLAGANQRYHE